MEKICIKNEKNETATIFFLKTPSLVSVLTGCYCEKYKFFLNLYLTFHPLHILIFKSNSTDRIHQFFACLGGAVNGFLALCCKNDIPYFLPINILQAHK